MPLDTKPIKRRLPVTLTTAERLDFGYRLAQCHHEYADLEQQKENVADDFKRQLDDIGGHRSRLARVVRDGEEYRDIECHWRYLFETNTKELVRMDTGEIIETQPISGEERQLMLQMQLDNEQESLVKEPAARI